MASKNIKIKRKTASGLDILYPETKAAQIRISEGVDISNMAENIIKLAKPSTSPKYMKIGTDGSITYGDDAAFIGASPAVHSHVIANIGAVGEGLSLQGMLDLKVPLVNGTIPAEYWPSWTKGHMKFVSTVNLTGETAIPLANIYPLLQLNTDGLLDIGNYLIVNTPGRVSTSAVEPYSNIIGADDGEITNPYLENGDWIILIGYEASPESYSFALISNQHNAANTGATGIVQIADATGKTKRSDLSSSSDNTKIVSEGLLRSVLKNIELTPIHDFGGGATTRVTRVIPTGISHTSGAQIVTGVSGSIGDYALVADNSRIYELTTYSGGSNYEWTYRGTITIPGGGFTQFRLYWWPALNELRYAVNATPENTQLPIFPSETNDIFFES